jgi:hypothetical protein
MQKVKPATAKAYISALRSSHIQNNYTTSAFDDPRIDLVIRGGKRIHGEGERRIRLPLTADILERIIREINNDGNGLNIKAALCVAFAGFLRSGEFTWETWDCLSSQSHLARKHVTFNANGSVTLVLPSSKTDPYGKGTAIHLSQANSAICPVQALTTLFRNQPKLPNDPLFSRTIGSFNRTYIVENIKELLLRSGISNANFSGHSLRKGAAVTAAANGISKENIKLLGRWRSDAVDIYINELAEKDHISKLLQLNAQLHYKTTLSHPTKTQLFSSPKLSALSALNDTHQRSTLPWQGRN